MDPIERFDSRRADRLTMGFNLVNQEITNMTHPGMQIQLADVLNPILLDENSGTPGVHGLLFQGVPLAFYLTS